MVKELTGGLKFYIICLFDTEKGVDIQEQIQKQWRKLYHAYSEIIGYDEGEALVKQLHHFSDQLENK